MAAVDVSLGMTPNLTGAGLLSGVHLKGEAKLLLAGLVRNDGTVDAKAAVAPEQDTVLVLQTGSGSEVEGNTCTPRNLSRSCMLLILALQGAQVPGSLCRRT